MKSKPTNYYTVQILPRGKKKIWCNLIPIAYFWAHEYKNIREARYHAGRLAVGLYKNVCRVFVVTDYFRGNAYCHRMEEVTETEEGIL